MQFTTPRSFMTTGLVASLSLGSALIVAPAFANADDSDWATRPTMTGDWGGARTRLADQGVKLTGDYNSETFGLVHGGIKHGVRYTQQIRLGATFDMSKILGVENGGTVQLTINDRRGNSASEDLVGNRLPIQENAGGNYTRLSELSYERSFFTPDFKIKAGYMSMGNDFGGMPVLTNFVNAGFCAHPLTESGGSGWTNYPTARWGSEFKYRINDAFSVQTAVFEVNPEWNSQSRNAFGMRANGKTGVIMPLEVIYNYNGPLHGQYKFGYYYDTSDTARIGDSSTKVAGRDGGYIVADQTIWQDDADKQKNLHLFGQATTSNSATSAMTHWYSVGLVRNKPFDSRPNDSVAIGYGRAVFNSRSRDVQEAAASTVDQENMIAGLDSGEQLIEVNYGYQATPWLMLRPDVQYIVEPGAFYGQNTDNALVVGLQVKATF